MIRQFNGLVTRIQKISHKNIIINSLFYSLCKQLAAKNINEDLFVVLNQ